VTVSVNGSSNLSGFTTSLIQGSTGVTFTASTGLIAGTSAAGARGLLSVSGLPLGWHTVRFTRNGSDFMYSDTFDIITPIHISESSLKIGSQSLKSVTKYSPEKSVSNAGSDLSRAKAWVVYDTANQKILSSFNISAVLRVGVGQGVIYFEKQFKDDKFAHVATATTGEASITLGGKYPSQVAFLTTNSAGTIQDTSLMTVVFFGELIDE
jgi:hypothetical protein